MRMLIFAIATALSFNAAAGGMAGKKGHGCAYSGDYSASRTDVPKATMDRLLADAESMKMDHKAEKAPTALGTTKVAEPKAKAKVQ
ncbi:MAG: hypothetical protein AAF493_14795 [Pseudomonadota bacterium]